MKVRFATADLTVLPSYCPAPLFEVVDDRASRYWRFHASETGVSFTLESLTKDPYFYDRLTDGDDAATIEQWRRWKLLLDQEFLSIPDQLES